MPVVGANLAADLLPILKDLRDDPATVAQDWADAYGKYAKSAIAGPALPQFTGGEPSVMSKPIASAMGAPSNNSSAFAAALASGMEAFWLAPPVVFTPPGGAGAVTSFPGKPALIAGLTSALSSPQPEEAAAQAIASQLDVATKTVLVTYTIPPNPPVITPIT
jgi:hypothetical protein